MKLFVTPVALLFVLGFPIAAPAQGRVPTEGSIAVGAGAGVFMPSDDRLESTPAVEGQVEFYVTPRFSVRFGLGWADPSFESEDEDSLRQLRVGGDFIYNWENNEWHPFVGAGIAAHLLQQKDNGRDLGEGQSKLGVALLGGVEYFVDDALSVKGEGRYQFVDEARRGIDPSGFVLAGGLKAYF